jgi:hypothetical protein
MIRRNDVYQRLRPTVNRVTAQSEHWVSNLSTCVRL